jgi:hypothetical protein
MQWLFYFYYASGTGAAPSILAPSSFCCEFSRTESNLVPLSPSNFFTKGFSNVELQRAYLLSRPNLEGSDSLTWNFDYLLFLMYPEMAVSIHLSGNPKVANDNKNH